ncbi:hypothetical protein C900_03174 [Fulvivirga imtechensis AK7]|uniref:Late embryogenesis abundant protein LEA-2 subgroup domain-containing protein n=2 Tax=Fulvivirga TaxID=396811 RepID=L8JU16_9BACT|nr:hypothetical protein C900_03174 [Fulvivirga imtechensis AK7]
MRLGPMRSKCLISIIAIVIVLTGCTRPEEAPVLKRVTNVEVTKVTGKEALLNADAIFFNPNRVSMKLRKVEVDVELEGKKIGQIEHSMKTKIPANAEFTVPLDATFNMKEVGLLKSVLSMLGGKKMKVHYRGFIKVTVHGLPIKVPVDYEDEVRL